jgi:alpha-amylase/alpha-mannosidase (GH57 family)
MSATPPRYVCIHGHFYQPPRESPWLEAVEAEPSAAPYHDWNERITRECYAPNSRSRLLDAHGHIVHLLNNYARISFNFGPTLLAWMEQHAPDVLQGIVEGDRLSRERRGGHGNALAQVYNHLIMPLASPRDQATQVRWGLADFRRRFGRDAEGMWLPETAVDVPTLEVLAEHGLKFTILAPRQAKRWRPLSGADDDWQAVPDGIDPSRAYLCKLPSGRRIALFFYDANVSRQVAFERLLDSGDKFVARLKGGLDDKRKHPQLMHIATDGESYGHHHHHGDMGLAFALAVLERDPDVRLTNYGEYLEKHPPEWEVEIHENSSWSCFHGVERWRSGCGCSHRGDWQQGWRGPLRAGLDALKERLDELFETEGARYFRDPWAARDNYVHVVLDRSEANVAAFLGRHALRPRPRDATPALWLLEMQRHAMLMFTSCGWFFDEISGLETTQCLRYAARAVHLARDLGRDFEEELLTHLAAAPSNIPQFGNGRAVWEQLVRPARVDLERVLAHHAMRLLYHPDEANARVYCFDLEADDLEVRTRGGLRLAVGRVRVRSRLTLDEAEMCFVVMHYGGLDFHAVLRPAIGRELFERFKRQLFETYENGSVADLAGVVAREFPGTVHRIDDLFADERRRIIEVVLRDRLEDYRGTLARLADMDADVLARLGRMRTAVPAPMRLAASEVLDQRVLEQVRHLDGDAAVERLRGEVERASLWGYRPDRQLLQKELAELVDGVMSQLGGTADLPALTSQAARLLEAARLLGVPLDLWQAQNHLLDAYRRLLDGGALNGAIHAAFLRLADRLGISRQMLGWRP